MSNPHEKDHWRELADLLGLPPDEHQAAPASPPPAPYHEPEPKERKPELAATDWAVHEAGPVAADSLAPAAYEEVPVNEEHVPIDHPGESGLSDSAPNEFGQPELTEPERGAHEESPHDRPRRGRRRGRRGQKDDDQERGNRTPHEAASRMEDGRLPAEEPLGEDAAQVEPSVARAEDRGARDHRRRPPEPRRRDVDEDDVLDMDDVEPAELVEAVHEEEDDDEEIDKLTDWNVPSWAELIGSLYRPER
jgi:hypothetical protein